MARVVIPKGKGKFYFAGLLAVLGGLAWCAWSVVMPFLLGFLLAYILYPLVRALEKIRIPRLPSSLIITGLIILVVISLVIPMVLKILAELGDLSEVLATRDYRALADHLLESYKTKYQSIPMPEYLRSHLRDFFSDTTRLQGIAITLLEQLKNLMAGAAKKVGSIILAATSSVATIAMIPVIAFYMLLEFEKVSKALYTPIPQRFRPVVENFLSMVDRIFSGFFRGQILVCLVIGVLMSIALTIIGVRFALVVGFMTGLANIVPYLGAMVGFAASIIVSIITFPFGWPLFWAFAKICLAFGLIQGFDGFFLSPRIIGDSVDIHPLMIMFALMVGALVAGIPGMALAVPGTAVIMEVLGSIELEFDGDK